MREESEADMYEIQYKLATKIVGNRGKLDFFVSGYRGEDKISSYEGRVCQKNLLAIFPPQLRDLKELVKYVEDDRNYKFNPNTRELNILFGSGSDSETIYIDMIPNVREMQQAILKLTKRLKQFQGTGKNGDAPNLSTILSYFAEISKINQRIYMIERRIEKIGEAFTHQNKKANVTENLLLGLSKDFQTHIGIPIKEWIALRYPSHPKEFEAMRNQRKVESTIPIDSKSPFIKEFTIDKKMITYSGNDRTTQLVGAVPLAEQNSFKIKVLKEKGRNMGVGVVDARLLDMRDPNWDNPHLLFYHGWDGSLWGDGKGKIKNQGEGYGTNNTVKLTADLETGNVQWEMNGSLKVSYTMEKLKDKAIRWVPYIRMCDTGDQIEWQE